MAISHGLCAEWQKDWQKDWNANQMVEKFFKGIGFFIKKRFVSNHFIKNNFDRKFLRDNYVIVDDTRSLLNPPKAVILGDSRTKIRINGYHLSEVYLLDTSVSEIIVKGNAFVVVYTLDNAQVSIVKEADSRVSVINCSDDTCIVAGTDVKVIQKRYTDEEKSPPSA